MEHTYQYSWVILFVTLLVPMLIGAGSDYSTNK